MTATTEEQIIDDLCEKNWAVVDNFLSPQLIENLNQELTEEYENGEFRQAGIGRKGINWQLRPEIRSDYVKWLDAENLTSSQQNYFDMIEGLRKSINQNLFLSLNFFEAHFAVYPHQSFYKKHLDNHAGSNKRYISCILYLNKDWKEDDNGKLRIYKNESEDCFTDILPIYNRFVCMRSDVVWHEVLPTQNERHRKSITGWLRYE